MDQENLQLRRPGLMIPGTIDINNTFSSSQTRCFLPFPIGKVISQEHCLPHLKVPHEHVCRGSYQGWLVLVEKDMSVYLLNPFSGTRMDLPPITTLPKPRRVDNLMSKWYIHKAILSAIPSSSSSSTSDCIIMVIFGRDDLAFCKLGDKTWTPIEFPKMSNHADAIYHKGMFHVVNHIGVVSTCDITAKKPTITQLDPPSKITRCSHKWYLAESSKGELLQILRMIEITSESDDEDEDEEDVHVGYVLLENDNNNESITTTKEEDDEEEDFDDDEEETDIEYDDPEYDEFDYDNDCDSEIGHHTYRTTGFKVCKLDTTESEPKWRRVENLDGEALFLGFSQSFSISQPQLLGYQRNRIYFTDDHISGHKLYLRSGNDMGVFKLEDSTFEPLYSTDSDSTKPPAIWITPTSS